jgi:hypothetical protein
MYLVSQLYCPFEYTTGLYQRRKSVSIAHCFPGGISHPRLPLAELNKRVLCLFNRRIVMELGADLRGTQQEFFPRFTITPERENLA